MTNKLENWKTVIAQATKEKKSILIKGYESSNKDTADYVVTPGIPNLYKTLVEQSQSELLELDLKVIPTLKSAGIQFTLTDLAQAVTELQTSFANSLSGENKRDYTAKKIFVDSGLGYFTAEATSALEHEELAIRHLLRESQTITFRSPKAEVKSKPVTILKSKIKALLPISNYIPQLNISEIKVQNVTLAE